MDNNKTFLDKTKSFFNSLLWDLPFENYHKYYKTGIIQNMSKDEKFNLYCKRNEDSLFKNVFITMLTLRPNIMDDKDVIKYNEVKIKADKELMNSVIGLGLSTAIHTYLLLFKRKKVLSTFILSTTIIILYLAYTNHQFVKEKEIFYLKYKSILGEETLRSFVKSVYKFE